MSIVNQFPQRTTTVQVIAPVDNDGTAITGIIIDRLGYQSAKLVVSFAASSGTPTTAAAAISMYSNSASSSSSPTPVLLVALATAQNIKVAGVVEYDIDLSNAKRYIYPTFDSTYVDGTTPKNIVSAVLVLGDKNVQPANSGTVYGR
jgi:hypothetical protein